MRPLFLFLTVFSGALFAQAPGVGRAAVKPRNNLALTAGGLPDGSSMPQRFTCEGANVSPPLSWSGEPEGTRSFALIVDDQDARGFNHWLLWDLPASVHSLAEGAKAEGTSGRNDFGDRGYGGPCPPAGRGSHVYSFRLFALDVRSLNLAAGGRRDALDSAVRNHVLAKAEYRLKYGH